MLAVMEENQHQAASTNTSRERGGRESAIRSALTRPRPAGPAHWEGRREVQEPVDVVGSGLPGKLPPTC